MLQTYGSNASVEDAIRSTEEIIAQRGENVKKNYSREMDTVKALEQQNALMKEKWEYRKEQTRKRENIGKKADRAEVRKIGRQLIRNYSSNTNIEDILPDLQLIANQNDSYSDMVDAAEGIARKILEGSGVDVNADLAETRERLKKYLRIKWMQAGKLSLRGDSVIVYLSYLLSGAAAGTITGILGAGGGLILVPLLSSLCHTEDSVLFPTSLSVMLPICAVSLFSIRSAVSWADAIPYLLGSVIGGLTAVFLRNKIPVKWLHRILGLFILWGGIRFLW